MGVFQHFGQIEVKMKPEMVKIFMAQFVFGVDTPRQKEVFSAVGYLMLRMLSRLSVSTFVSLQ